MENPSFVWSSFRETSQISALRANPDLLKDKSILTLTLDIMYSAKIEAGFYSRQYGTQS